MQCIPCNSVLLAKEALFLTPPKKNFFCPKISKKCLNRNMYVKVYLNILTK